MSSYTVNRNEESTQLDDIVFAVKCDGEDFMFVAEDEIELKLLENSEGSFGQCENCGGWTPSGECVGFTILASAKIVRCDGCGRESRIVRQRSSEVCF